MSFYELLQEIRKRPSLYLSRNTIFDFESFLLGYEVARKQAGIDQTVEEQEFSIFLEWVRKICPIKTDRPWTNIVLFYSADERDALNKVFSLFDDFQKSKESGQESEKLLNVSESDSTS